MKILFTGVYSHLHGGLECFAARAADVLRENGHEVDVAGDPPQDAGAYDFVLMHKAPRKLEELRRLKAQCGEKLRFFAHDHELYCLRRHYYDPFRRLCDRTYSFIPCRLCAAVTRPQWILRNLAHPISAFIREMSEVRSFATSNYIKRNLERNGFPPGRVKTVYPYFARPFFEEAAVHRWMPDGKLRVLFIGQLLAGKGIGLLVEASSLMKAPHRLIVVGAGRDEAKLRRAAGAEVEFMGWQENAHRFMAEADVCAFPSLWSEPFGMVGAEAMSHGVPTVAFDVGGTRDWLVPGETGLFASTADGRTACAGARTAAALAAALDRMVDSAALAKMGANAIERASRLFDPSRFVATLLS